MRAERETFLEANTWQRFQQYGLLAECTKLPELGKTSFWQIESANHVRWIGFSDGYLISASSEDPSENLIQVFLDRELFTLEQYIQASGNFQEGESLGKGLLAFGLVTLSELESGQKEQIFRIFKASVLQKEGRFRCFEKAWVEMSPSHPVPIEEAVVRACLEFEDKPWIASNFADVYEFQMAMVDSRFNDWEEAGWATDLKNLLPHLRTGTSILDVIHASSLPEFNVLKWIFGFKTLGWVKWMPNVAGLDSNPTSESGAKLSPEPVSNGTPYPAKDIATNNSPNRFRLLILGAIGAGLLLVFLTLAWMGIVETPSNSKKMVENVGESEEQSDEFFDQSDQGSTNPTHQALIERNLPKAAALWSDQIIQEEHKFTLGIFMACDPENVLKLWRNQSQDEHLFALPFRFQGEQCYWVCWGKFFDRNAALAARLDMPAFLLELAPDAEPLPFEHFRL